jgi:tripartite-type tricarboxylate transporter receptor subunit TctC
MKKALLGLAVALAALSLSLPALAAWPEKPLTMYAVFAPGGSLDSSARGLAAAAEKLLGQPIVVTTKEGAAGTTGLGVLANDKPDGYTLAAATSTGILRVPMSLKVPYKPLASFTNIFAYAAPPTATVVMPDSPFKTFKDLVEFARKNPGKVRYSTAGVGSPMHLCMAVIGIKEKINWIHVPFKGSAPAETALMGGHVEACSTGDLDKVVTGQLKPLVVHTKERMKQFPDVPTLMDLGYNYFNDTLFSIFGPAGMDPAVVKRLEDAFDKAVDAPEFRKVCDQFALVPVKVRSAEYTKFLKDQWPIQVDILKSLELIKEPASAPK